MSFFCSAVYCRIKQLANKSLLIAFAFFLTAITLIGAIFGDAQSLQIKIGVYHSNSEFAQNLEKRFKFYAENQAQIIKFNDINELQKHIMSNRLECGYLLPDSAVAPIELFISPFTVSEQISNIMLASAIFEHSAGEMGHEVIRHYLTEDSSIIEDILLINKDYLQRGKFMELNYMGMKSGQVFEPVNSVYFILSGMGAMFIMLISFLGAGRLVNDPIPARLHLNILKTYYFLGNITAFFVVNLSFFVVLQYVAGFYTKTDVTSSLLTTSIYCLIIATATIVLAKLCKRVSFVLFISILSFLTCMVFGGVFANTSEFLPELDFIKYITPTHYYMMFLKLQ